LPVQGPTDAGERRKEGTGSKRFLSEMMQVKNIPMQKNPGNEPG